MMPDGLLAHRVEGAGEPVLLLNGGMMTCASWEPVAGRLRLSHRLVLCDLRGQLLTPGAVPENLAGNVPDVEALLDHLEIESAHLLGTSYGGQIALIAAALIPDRVRSLVAVAVSDRATPAIRKGARDLRRLAGAVRRGGDARLLHDRLAQEVYSEEYASTHADELAARREQFGLLPASWFTGIEGIVTAVESLDLAPCLPEIRCPTLVVIAGADRSIPPERSLALAASIRGSETRIHQTSGHALVAEDPEWLADAALEFFARQAWGAEQAGVAGRFELETKKTAETTSRTPRGDRCCTSRCT